MTPSVLVVEDDTALCELLTWNLSAEGYDVRSTPDGEEALLMVREQMPDAIILDWMIEQVPGIEVCRQLRKDKETAQVPILMLTARGEEEDMIRGFKTGADDYVTKPFSPANCSRALRRYCAVRGPRSPVRCCNGAISSWMPPRTACAGAVSLCTWGQQSFACCAISWNGPTVSSRASRYSMAYGA